MQSVSAGAEVGVGTVLGGTYEIVGLIGKGGMGAVWKAKHLRLPKQVAVKVLLHAVAAEGDAYARFRREAEVASKLGHPNIVEVLDFAELPSGTPYLVLELLEGESLATRLKRGPMPLERALSVTRQIASALLAAHREHVVHRDLKPENVYLLPRELDGVVTDHVKVLDFGISKIQGSQTIKTQEAMLLGTPQYMAPEQATGKNDQIDARTDQWALGVIVYEMLAGKAPFVGSNVAEVLFKVVYEPPEPLAARVPGLPENVTDAVARALSKANEDRFPDVSELVAALSGRPLVTIDRPGVRRPSLETAATLDPSGPVAYAETVGSGPQSPSAAPAAPVTTGRSRHLAIGVGVGAVLAGAAALGLYFALRAPAASPAPPDAILLAQAKPDAAPVVVVTKAPPDAAPIVALVPDAAPVQIGTKPVTRPPKPVPPAPPPSPEEEREEIKKLLQQADEALANGQWKKAEHDAQAVLRKQPGPMAANRALMQLALTACGRKDLNDVYAYMRQVPKGRWKELRKQCKLLGYPIETPPP